MSIGRLQELYLFRGKKAPFHHEFLVAGFGDDGREIESWMRIERSARTQGGSSGLPAGVESYGPLLGGVGARETISFSTSKATLSTNANELAKVILPAPTTLPIFIIAVGRQIQSTTNSNEKYQLFTTNCRWYSRRNFLNILQWCDIAKIPATALWKGTETSLERIQAKLEKERFGGSKLVDLRAKGLDYRNLIHLASSQSGGDSKRLSRAVLDPILESLMTTTLDPEERSVLIADLLTKRSHVVASEDLPQALEDAERAIKLMRDLPKNAFRRDEQLVWSLGALAHALLLDGRYEEAIPLLRESLELDDPRSHTFAMRLAELGVNHRFLGNMEEAIKALRQSAHLLGRMEGSDWTDTRLQRANILIILAQTFEGLDRDKEALPIRQEIVSMRRDLPGKDDDGDDLLTLALINLAKCAIPAEHYEAAQQASKEAIRRCRADTKNDHMLFMALLLSSHASYALDDMKTAIQNITAAMDLRSAADDSDEDTATRSRGSLLMTRSKYFLQIGDAHHALADIEAAITLSEAAHDHNPADSRIANKLWEMQFAAGNLLKRLDRADDALDAYRNAVNVRRPAVEADPEGPEQLVLELVLSLEGCATMLKELDRPNSAKFFAEETIYYLRLRNRSSVSSTNTSEALRMTLLRHTQYLSELGDEEEALALATEAAEISERLEADQLQVSALMHKMLQEVKNGYPERAIVTAEACFELCETRLSDRRDLRSLALTTYARALDEVGKHAEAAVKQEESISILREVADFTTLDAKTQLAQRLGKIAEYYQDAGIFDKALVSINEAVGRYRTLYEEGEAAGMEYTRSIARKASILFSLNRRKEAKIALDEEFEMLKIVLVSKSVDEILEQADARHSDAMIHTMNGKPADALDCARQHVLLTRLAWSFEPRYSKADDGKDEEEEKPKSVLETALFGLGMIATMNGYRMDAAEAMLEAFQLSQGLNLDLDGDIMQKLIADTTETELA
ncbi:TPR-like protein [Clavulina sp. PMI_390]|nr:TPR-like protein [Clavulina sp. PMI_390]